MSKSRFKKGVLSYLLLAVFFTGFVNLISPDAKAAVSVYKNINNVDQVISSFWEQNDRLKKDMEMDKYNYYVALRSINKDGRDLASYVYLNDAEETPKDDLVPLEEALEFLRIFLLDKEEPYVRNKKALEFLDEKEHKNFKYWISGGKYDDDDDDANESIRKIIKCNYHQEGTAEIQAYQSFGTAREKDSFYSHQTGMGALSFLAYSKYKGEKDSTHLKNQFIDIMASMDADVPLYVIPKEDDQEGVDVKTTKTMLTLSDYKKPMIFAYMSAMVSEHNQNINELSRDPHFCSKLNGFGHIRFDKPFDPLEIPGKVQKELRVLMGRQPADAPLNDNVAEKEPSEVAVFLYYDMCNNWERRIYNAKRYSINTAKMMGAATVAAAVWNTPKLIQHITKNALGTLSQKATDQFLTERAKLINNPIQLRVAINAMMASGVIGLKNVIDELSRMATGLIAISKNTSLFNKNHSNLIAFVGPPGTGKTLLAKKYGLAILGRQIPDCAMVNLSIYDDGLNPMDVLFNENSDLVKYIIACKGNCLLILDEIDKSPYGNLILERLRNAADSGTLEVTYTAYEEKRVGKVTVKVKVTKTRTIKVEGLTVIAITNEKPECWGLEPDPADVPEYHIGRTVVERSGSMVQRFKKFKFHPFVANEYAQMYKNALDSINKDSVKMFGVQVVFDKNLIDQLAKESVHRMMGGRSVPIVLEEMAGAVTQLEGVIPPKDTWFAKANNLVVNKLMKKPDKTIQNVGVSFDCDTHKFKVKLLEDKQESAN